MTLSPVDPQLQKPTDRGHELYNAHRKVCSLEEVSEGIGSAMSSIEGKNIQNVKRLLERFNNVKIDGAENLFKTAVEEEIKLYR